jgi:hypothetical protein
MLSNTTKKLNFPRINKQSSIEAYVTGISKENILPEFHNPDGLMHYFTTIQWVGERLVYQLVIKNTGTDLIATRIEVYLNGQLLDDALEVFTFQCIKK